MKSLIGKLLDFFFLLFNHRSIVKELEDEREQWGKDFFDVKMLKMYAEGHHMEVKFEAPVFKYFAWAIADAYEKIGPENYVACEMVLPDDRTNSSYELSIRKIHRGQSMANKNERLVRELGRLQNILENESLAKVDLLNDLASFQKAIGREIERRQDAELRLEQMSVWRDELQQALNQKVLEYNLQNNWLVKN